MVTIQETQANAERNLFSMGVRPKIWNFIENDTIRGIYEGVFKMISRSSDIYNLCIKLDSGDKAYVFYHPDLQEKLQNYDLRIGDSIAIMLLDADYSNKSASYCIIVDDGMFVSMP